jgi:DNA-binding PadR family transcriptional regulator
MTQIERDTDGAEEGDIQAIHELIGFQRDLLLVMSGLDEPSGQQIKEELEATSNQEITHGRLYPNLDTLVERGLVTKGEIDRRTNYYAISEKGIDSLQQHHDWASTQLLQ